MRASIILGSLVAGLVGMSSPALAQAAAKASAQSICKDGTTSSAAGRGACSSHGGVDSAATKAARASAKATKAEAKVAKAGKDSSAAVSKARRAEAKAAKAEDKAAKDSTGATAQCKDGTFSHAKSTQGACAAHGGIAKTLKP
ncbi:MAG TPA: hypothetical protein VKE42_01420 [Candidatus Cybelea sp.]|nr:hypothetical protein [Candidatus Cybelea sp.]